MSCADSRDTVKPSDLREKEQQGKDLVRVDGKKHDSETSSFFVVLFCEAYARCPPGGAQKDRT